MLTNMHNWEYNEIGISAAIHGFEVQSCLIIESQDSQNELCYERKQ